MVTLNLIENFAVALLLGLIVGLEREFQHQQQKVQDFAGVRTFTLIALLGWIIGFVAQQVGDFSLVLFGFAGMFLLIIAGYLSVVWKQKKVGTISAFSGIIVFLLGVLVVYQYILIAVISAILMTTLLSYKYHLHQLAQRLITEEVHAGLKLGIISLVVLPLLPNKAYSPVDIPILHDLISLFPDAYRILEATEIFNPFKLWLVVVFICAISTVGYIFMKLFGAKKGIGLVGIVGGIASSTATTSSLSESSKRSKLYYTFAFGVIIAWAMMFLRILFVILVLNKGVFFASLPTLGIMTVASAGCAAYLYFQRTPKGKKAETVVAFQSPFALMPALKLGTFFIFVLFLAKLLQELLGTSGIYLTSIITGFADIDPIIISMTTLVAAGEMSSRVAVTGITLAIASNTLAKTGIAYLFGGKEFAKKVAVCSGIILLAGLLSVVFL